MLIKAKRGANIYCTPTKLCTIFQLCHLSVPIIFCLERKLSLCWATCHGVPIHSGVVSLCAWCLGLILNSVPLHVPIWVMSCVLTQCHTANRWQNQDLDLYSLTQTHILNHYGINMFFTKFSWGKKKVQNYKCILSLFLKHSVQRKKL